MRVSLEFLEELELLVSAYLEIVPDNDGTEWCDSYRGFAQEELSKFLGWIRAAQQLEEDNG